MANLPTDQIQAAQREMESAIMTAVQTFSDKTGAWVGAIRAVYEREFMVVNAVQRPTGPRKVASVSAEVYLPKGD